MSAENGNGFDSGEVALAFAKERLKDCQQKAKDTASTRIKEDHFRFVRKAQQWEEAIRQCTEDNSPGALVFLIKDELWEKRRIGREQEIEAEATIDSALRLALNHRNGHSQEK